MSGSANAPATEVRIQPSGPHRLGIQQGNSIIGSGEDREWLESVTLPSDLIPLSPLVVVLRLAKESDTAQAISPLLAQIPRCQSAAIDWDDAARARTVPELASVAILNPEMTETAASVDEVVNELLKTIAQVALDTARRKGERAVMTRLRATLCEAKLTSGTKEKAVDTLLPNSCALLATLRLDDLQIAARSLQNAAFMDAAEVASQEVRTRMGDTMSASLGVDVLAALPRLTQTLVQAGMSGERTIVLQAATESINGIATENWLAIPGSSDPARRCVIGLATTAMRACAQAGQLGTCDVSTLVSRLFEVENVPPISRCLSVDGVTRPQVQSLAYGGIRALRALTHPDPGTTPMGVIAPTIEWLLLLAEHAGGTKISDEQRAALTLARSTTRALVAQDFQLLFAGIATHLSKNATSDSAGMAIRRGSAVIQSAVSYARTYEKADLAEAQAQRRKVIESLVDELNDRSNRGGETITTLGIPVGASVIGYGKTQGDWDYYTPQLSLPVTMAMQIVPAVGKSVGWHFGFSLLDLGQYVSYERSGDVTTPDWRTAFMIGGQAGILLGSSDNLFLVGVEGRYAPALFPEDRENGTRGGAVRFGLFAGYYVPLFDLN
ncbi:hypothetical protein [Myxococcus landrumensis]|uniref:Uncharacterized protein n=1 Tax=Myxococcus landrumensis TaxID=2813577 RepID=A0ABX7NFP9_9BACT|nr:hypothetical protein [Myxococcus landrumus]QSQ16324.1 hypothetical protein JY572_09860 [Myxococcus landrumus]